MTPDDRSIPRREAAKPIGDPFAAGAPAYAALIQYELARFGHGTDDEMTRTVSRLMVDAFKGGQKDERERVQRPVPHHECSCLQCCNARTVSKGFVPVTRDEPVSHGRATVTTWEPRPAEAMPEPGDTSLRAEVICALPILDRIAPDHTIAFHVARRLRAALRRERDQSCDPERSASTTTRDAAGSATPESVSRSAASTPPTSTDTSAAPGVSHGSAPGPKASAERDETIAYWMTRVDEVKAECAILYEDRIRTARNDELVAVSAFLLNRAEWLRQECMKGGTCGIERQQAEAMADMIAKGRHRKPETWAIPMPAKDSTDSVSLASESQEK